MTERTLHPDTMALHAGYRSDPTTGAVAVPIYQTTSYQFRDSEHAENLFALKELGNIYTRIMNPTHDVLEQRITALEGGVAALAVSSGQAASTFAVLNLCEAGDNFVCSTAIYGGTWNLFANTLKSLGIECRFVDPNDPENFRRATDKKTRCYYAETLPNPLLEVFPIGDVAKIGNEEGVPLIMDNTAAPLICRPLEHGASIVVYSTTKFIGGHGTSIGGMLVDGGTFDWEAGGDRFPLLNSPDPSYHGAVWTEAVKPLGPIAYILRARVILLRDFGSAMSPFNAFQFIQGVESLPVRMERHCSNAAKVANYLASNRQVSKVIYPGNHTGEVRQRADTYLSNGYGALVGFELAGGKEAGQKFIDALELLYHVANIGDARSLAIHPASTTHSQLSVEDQAAAGVTPGYVRLSIGLEHADDIIADIAQALEKA
ncbi:MAG: bifunctional O-acetylhomoserine aminocarboxypropyltransferase/cysteine synthase [Rhodospirillales bacterium]|nr:bifunctional O-acetylhomoserine aminocarboxypropyltransferase/cysteine synthase [Rhodospirillales bacterium]MBT4041660.1 bifunctional O-acetylhomoserine aminocarboxypropyltransferase/cysteine synthase [Rhodospirillales bacterium]MBT5350148.1 bifunctional O-acetylhomoserine aminocarboxypropyltransferase/cysteine synthase [Rhodospirillales bacterium]MBT5521014.1 bifunctional O-acetylhomoserine aminocarboxypropyltransferase/cysteine synthase [Rhodospirillales bacterium]MBT6108464.1 bifunctional